MNTEAQNARIDPIVIAQAHPVGPFCDIPHLTASDMVAFSNPEMQCKHREEPLDSDDLRCNRDARHVGYHAVMTDDDRAGAGEVPVHDAFGEPRIMDVVTAFVWA